MRVLLDNCVDVRLKNLIGNHEVIHVVDLGWEALTNGNLLAAAESKEFDVFVTVDKNLQHQQNFASRRLGLIVLNPLFITLDNLVPLIPELIRALDKGIPLGSISVINSH